MSLQVSCPFCADFGVEMSVLSLEYLVAKLFVAMGIDLGELAFLVWMHLDIGECIPWMNAFDIVGSVFNLLHVTHFWTTHC